MADHNHLYGSCACERNQYMIIIPPSSAELAQVFFDNTAANRRSQASLLTAWLRVPLEWYHSVTIAHFPDESHASIKRAFYHAPPSNHAAVAAPTRRQFCGYCGTHLTAWNEMNRSRVSVDSEGVEDQVLDVTLGSLAQDSVDLLEELGVLSESSSSEDEEEDEHTETQQSSDPTSEGLVKGGRVNVETHIHPPNSYATSEKRSQKGLMSLHRMQGRGVPFFEDMVENSRLGRIKRQTGGHTSSDGRTTVQWEIIEIGPSDEEDDEVMVDEQANVEAAEEQEQRSGNKRRKVNS